MALLVTTRGLGKRGGFLSTSGLGNGIFESPGEGKADSYRFHDKLSDQIDREDEELLIICRGFIEVICR
jgi:hypothetical protein